MSNPETGPSQHPPKTNQPPDLPPDLIERQRALDPTRSFLVQAPAGSGKTYLLTQRFLRLLALAEKPDAIVAITFTKAAAAEMQHRILEALEKAQAAHDSLPQTQQFSELPDPESLESLAARAMERSRLLGWEILDQPSQLRVMTIDSFCRSIALQSPLGWGALSELGGNLDTVDNPKDLYRKAARRTLEILEKEESDTRRAVEEILLWRDNNWQDVETLIVEMLGSRNRWRQEFVFTRDNDWVALREKLERPFRRGAQQQLDKLASHLEELPEFHSYVLTLARSACESPGRSSPLALAERAELPRQWRHDHPETQKQLLEDAIDAYQCVANFLLKNTDKTWRKKRGLDLHDGFPATPAGRAGKERFGELIDSLAEVDGLEQTLAVFKGKLPIGYPEDEWQLIRHCFTLLRHAAAQLHVVFAETGTVDFTEIAQMALNLMAPEDGIPSEVAIRQAESIHHLLIDEFQDTSRNQHQLIERLIGSWPEREGRTCFCVGDPMQSIYGFREAEVELFDRLRTHGFAMHEFLDTPPFHLDFLSLRANFRTAPSLVQNLNGYFGQIFAVDDGSGVTFSPAEATRENLSSAKAELHLAFTYQGKEADPEKPSFPECLPETTRKLQIDSIVALIREKLEAAKARQTHSTAAQKPEKFRIAVLGRTKASVTRIALALEEAEISFRAIDLVSLRERPEVLDALSIMRALLNPMDRTAWLALMRAPWCGLTLAELHLLTSADDAAILAVPVPELLSTRLPQLIAQNQIDARTASTVNHVRQVMATAIGHRISNQPFSTQASGTQLLGTRIESIWKALGGDATVNAAERENLQLLWKALDTLPEGEVDLLGAGLNSALENLYALPDPAASSDFGVQLMTIHKSKGLEFEVVIVPELEAASRSSVPAMISWLERGLTGSESESEDGELTEFLIAPIQAKGTDAGAAKSWVDRIKKSREKQELRRLLYVAATRAREELHLFARPKFSISKSQPEPTLATITGLLLTAWPAFEETVETQFANWVSERAAATDKDTDIEYLAAGVDSSNLLMMPASQRTTRPTMLRRLPADYLAQRETMNNSSTAILSSSGSTSESTSESRNEERDPEEQGRSLFTRTEGGLESRLLGTAIHNLLEDLAQLRLELTPAEAAQALADSLPRVVAQIRERGLSRSAAERLAAEAIQVAKQASVEPVGAWILAPHPHAASESRWTGLLGPHRPSENTDEAHPPAITQIRWNIRPDRVFFAPMPLISDANFSDANFSDANFSESPTPGESIWWIIDYKSSTTSATSLSDRSAKEVFALGHRDRYKPQLDVYARVLRQLHQAEGESQITVRAGIFYPRLGWLDHFAT